METATLPSGTQVILIPPITHTPPATYCPTGHVWLAPGDGDGRGTPEDPYRIAGPEALDAALATHGGEGCTIHLAPGEYHTRGSWAFQATGFRALRGASLVGAGSEETTIHLSEPVEEANGQPRKDLNILWGQGDDIRVEGLTLDGHARDLPGRTVGGLYVWGNRLRARDVVVRDIRGDFEASIEVFGIGTVGGAGGARIDECRVEGVPGTYVSAISVGYRPEGGGAAPALSLVRGCAVVGERCHFAYGACHATTFRDCTSEGFNYGFYNDTDEVDGVLLDGCRLEPNYSGIHLVLQKPTWRKRRLRVEACTFDFRDPGNGMPFIGLGLIDNVRDANPGFSEIQVSRCRFTAPRSPFYLYSTNAQRMSGVVLVENTTPQQTHKNGVGPILSRNLTPTGEPPTWV